MPDAVGITPTRGDSISDASLDRADSSLTDGISITTRGGVETQLAGPLGQKTIVKFNPSDDLSYNTVVPDWELPFAQPKALSALPSALVNAFQASAMTVDGAFLAGGISVGSAPYLCVYKRAGDGWLRLADPTLTLFVNDLAWTTDTQYLAVASSTANYFAWFKRTGDTLAALTNPATMPTGTANSVAWSPDGSYLIVSHGSASPFVTIYKRSGDTLTKLTNPATLPTSGGRTAWSPDSLYLAVATAFTGPVAIYKRSGDVFTKLSDPDAAPPGACTDIAWSPGGIYLIATHNNAPFATIYKRSGDVLTKITTAGLGFNTPPPATTAAQAVAWHPSSKYVGVVHDTTPYLAVYKRVGDVFTKITDLPVLTSAAARSLDWSLDGRILTFAQSTSISAFKAANEIFGGQPVRLPADRP